MPRRERKTCTVEISERQHEMLKAYTQRMYAEAGVHLSMRAIVAEAVRVYLAAAAGPDETGPQLRGF